MSEHYCPKCRHIELELHFADEPKEHGHGFQPTKTYYFCPSCFDTYPVGYDDTAEA